MCQALRIVFACVWARLQWQLPDNTAGKALIDIMCDQGETLNRAKRYSMISLHFVQMRSGSSVIPEAEQFWNGLDISNLKTEQAVQQMVDKLYLIMVKPSIWKLAKPVKSS